MGVIVLTDAFVIMQVVEHQSDVVRLEIMLQIGGIYLDTDSVVLKPLNSFLENHEMVLGEASDFSLGKITTQYTNKGM